MLDGWDLLVYTPLIVALLVTLRKLWKLRPWSSDKAYAWSVVRGAVYILVATLFIWAFAPEMEARTAIVGMFITSIFALLSILVIVDLPNKKRFNGLHNLAWKEGPKTPLYRRTGRGVPYVRWARRFALVLVLAFALISAGYAALFGGQAGSDTIASPSVVRTTEPAPGASATAEPETPDRTPEVVNSTDERSPAPGTLIENPCEGGPHSLRVRSHWKEDFRLGTNIQVCYDNKWQDWTVVYAEVVIPERVTLIAGEDTGIYAYGVVVFDDRQFLFRTDDPD